MATPALPTLTKSGFLKPDKSLLERLLLYFIASEYSQSIIYQGKISSLKYLLMKYGNDENKLITEVNYTLTDLYKRYFDSVNIKVDIKTSQDQTFKDKIQRTLVINIEATYNGKLITLNEELDITKNNISELDYILSKTIS